MIQQIKKDYKLIKNKGNFQKRLSEKINRSQDTIKVHYFGYWNISNEMQPIIHEHILKELERQKTLDFTVDEMLEEIASYKYNGLNISIITLDFSVYHWVLDIGTIKEKIIDSFAISPREACLDTLKFIKGNPELFTKKN